MTHHRNGPRAWRLILAKLHADRDAEQLVYAEHGSCPRCLTDTADALAEIATTLLTSKTGHDSASSISESEIDLALEAADRDDQDLPITPAWVEKCLRVHSALWL